MKWQEKSRSQIALFFSGYKACVCVQNGGGMPGEGMLLTWAQVHFVCPAHTLCPMWVGGVPAHTVTQGPSLMASSLSLGLTIWHTWTSLLICHCRADSHKSSYVIWFGVSHTTFTQRPIVQNQSHDLAKGGMHDVPGGLVEENQICRHTLSLS